MDRRIEEEHARIGAVYRRVLEGAVDFEKRIRDRGRQNSRAKNARVAELEQSLEDEVGGSPYGGWSSRAARCLPYCPEDWLSARDVSRRSAIRRE